MLLAGLERLEPDLIPVLRRRAASWCLRHGLRDEALEYSMAAGDVEAAGRLVEALMVPFYWQGGGPTPPRGVLWAGGAGGGRRRAGGDVWAAGWGGRMGGGGGSLAVGAGGRARRSAGRGVGCRASGPFVPSWGPADARRRRRGRTQVRGGGHCGAGRRGLAGDRVRPVR